MGQKVIIMCFGGNSGYSVIFSFWDIFIWLKRALWPNSLAFFRSFQNNLGLWPKNPKNQVETQSKEMFLIFRTTPLGVRCMAAAPLVATALYFIQSKSCFSMNWFNVATMFWAAEQIPTLRQHNLTMVFVSWLTNPQHKSAEPLLKYLLFHWAKYQTTELSSVYQEDVSTNLLKYEDIYV